MHFSRKFRPREFNATSDRVQRIDNVTTFLYLAANEVFVDPHVRHRPLIMRLLFLLTTFRGSDISVVFLHRTQYDACFMFRVRAILKGLHRGHHLLFANVCELHISGKHVRSQTTSLVLFGFQVDQQIAIRSTGSVLIGFYRKL